MLEREIWKDDRADIEVQINALGMLVRMHVRGVDGLQDKWEEVLDAIGDSPYIHAYPLHNLLRLCALCAAGRESEPLLGGLAQAAAEDANLRDKVLPLALALRDLFAGDEEKREVIEALRGDACWSQAAGSEEQRGFILELVHGPVRAGIPISTGKAHVPPLGYVVF